MQETFVCIGHTKKCHGLKGELKVFVEERFVEDFLKNERIFLDIKGRKVPYFIANVRGGGEMILQLEEVTSRDEAFLLQSREVFLREKDILPDHLREIEVDEETLEYAFVQGFELHDKTIGLVGTIEEVLDMPQQEMAWLRYKGREVMIPLNKSLIVSIDRPKKLLKMDLPEGLLDM